jgi:hypothetical protein
MTPIFGYCDSCDREQWLVSGWCNWEASISPRVCNDCYKADNDGKPNSKARKEKAKRVLNRPLPYNYYRTELVALLKERRIDATMSNEVCTMCKGDGYVYLPNLSTVEDTIKSGIGNLFQKLVALSGETAYTCEFCKPIQKVQL